MVLGCYKERLVKKAMQSHCNYKVAAFGFNKKGELIYQSVNKHRFTRKGGGIHAEMEVMLKAGPGLKTIIICRTNRSGDLLPIDPCPTCAGKADELGIKIKTVKE